MTDKATRSWLITIREPTDDHVEAIISGKHDYALWRVEEDGSITLILHYRYQRARPEAVWQRLEYEPVYALVKLIEGCNAETGWDEYGVRPEKGSRRWAEERRAIRENIAKSNPTSLLLLKLKDLEEDEVILSEKIWDTRAKIVQATFGLEVDKGDEKRMRHLVSIAARMDSNGTLPQPIEK